MTGLLWRIADGNDASKAPIDHVFREMQDKAVAFSECKVVTLRRETVGAGHGIGGLRGQQPIEFGGCVVDDMKAHLPAGDRFRRQLDLDAFEKKALRVIAVATALPGIIVAVVAVLKFLGRV